jgi:protein-glucosylgalactosylhydroxylysine glucosidase
MTFKKACTTFLLAIVLTINFSCQQKTQNTIDRKVWIERHFPTLEKAEPLSPFSVGNGEFAFTADITGLQTFPDFYENDIPLGTQAQWGWHSIPNPENYQLDVSLRDYDSHGRQVSYASNQRSPGAQWLRANPHRLHLGQIGLKILKNNGDEIQLEDVSQIDQKLDLWEGVLYSSFNVENSRVNVETYAHPDQDQMGAKVTSQLVQDGKLAIRFKFPYGCLSWGKQTTDWESPEKHASKIISQKDNSVTIERKLDEDSYYITVRWNSQASFESTGTHEFVLTPKDGNSIEFTSHFYKQQTDSPDNLSSIKNASTAHWRNYWETGGAIDLSGSIDPRANELERRIVLSRYLTAIQCAGSQPPQETGLTFNSWHGKFHLEMHWWHAVHFVFWGQPDLLEKSIGWYYDTMNMAKSKAIRQWYDGVRWGKMVGPDGRESPSGVGVFLIWQQPHPIYYAEILYRAKQDKAILIKYQKLVEETANFMASFAYWDESGKRYTLGPPLIPAQEIYRPAETFNAAFELSYWKFGLETAQKWRERLDLPPVEKWDHVIKHLSKLPIDNGFYQNTESGLNTFTNPWHRNDHPTVLGAYGYLPNDEVDVALMQKTLNEVMKSWNWQRTWGWDYPLVAMTAARVGKPDIAIDALLMDVQKNTYLNNGHNYQDKRLTIYLPGNGGLLTATAMMAAGWDGAPDVHAPGFPQDGSWDVKYEGLSPMP